MKKLPPGQPDAPENQARANFRVGPELGPRELSATRAELSRRRFSHFVRHAWPIADPAVFVPGWHIDAIAEHLEAVTAGEIKRLIINVPPRHMKSTCVSVLWPAWVWGPLARPGVKWLFASYAANLAIRDSVRCRRIIESAWYQALWGDVVQLSGDQNTKARFEISCGPSNNRRRPTGRRLFSLSGL